MSTAISTLPAPAVKTRHTESKAVRMTAKEHTSRAAAVDSANGHNAMEGLFSSAFSQELQNRYVSGEMDIEEAVQAARRHYGLA